MKLSNLFRSTPTVSTTEKEYRLMYFYEIWRTVRIIYAESAAEAIYEAREELKTLGGVNATPCALFCGDRLVKRFNFYGAPYRPQFTAILQ